MHQAMMATYWCWAFVPYLQVVPIRCYTYEGRPVSAVTLQGARASLHTSRRQAAPSERYLRLLREGGPWQQAYHYAQRPVARCLARLHARQQVQVCVCMMLWPIQVFAYALLDRACLMSCVRNMATAGLLVPGDGRDWQAIHTHPALQHVPCCAHAAGAAHHGLDAAYQQRLQQLQPFTRGTWSATFGGAASAAILLGAAAPAIPLYVAGRSLGLLPSKPAAAEQPQGAQPAAAGGGGATNGPVPDLPKVAAEMAEEAAAAAATGGLPAYLSWYFNAASRATWLMHDYVLQPVLGSGSSTSKQQQQRR